MKNVTSYTNFLFIFPTAVWVNLIAPQFAQEMSLGQLATYIALFLFIPAELVSSAMWQRVSILRPGSAKTSDFQEGLLGFIDIFRILSLTIAYSTITAALAPDASLGVVSILALAMGMFLLLNFLWNKVEMPADVSVFRLMHDRLSDHLKVAMSARDALGINFALQGYRAFNLVHNFFISAAFPMLGLVLTIIAILCLADVSTRSFLAGSLFLKVAQAGILGVFALQVVFKSFQILALSYVASFMETFAPVISRISTNHVHVVEVDIRTMEVLPSSRTKLREIAEFRFEAYTADRNRRYPGLLFLSKDEEWDQHSIHVIAMDGTKTVGVARLSIVRDNRLPVSEESAFNRPLREGEYELSRFVVHPEWRMTHAIVALFAGVVSELRQRRDMINLYADILTDDHDTFSCQRFERMGFKRIGVNYLDRRYDCRSEIMKLVEDDFPIFASHIDRLTEFSKRRRRSPTDKVGPLKAGNEIGDRE